MKLSEVVDLVVVELVKRGIIKPPDGDQVIDVEPDPAPDPEPVSDDAERVEGGTDGLMPSGKPDELWLNGPPKGSREHKAYMRWMNT